MDEYELARQEHEERCHKAAMRRAAKRARAVKGSRRHATGAGRAAAHAAGGSGDAAQRGRILELVRIVRHPLTATIRKA